MAKQKGFAFIQLLLFVAVVAAVALIGLRVANNRVSDDQATVTSSQTAPLSATVSSAPQIKSTADLDKASQTLDQNDPETANQLDSAQLDKDSADF